MKLARIVEEKIIVHMEKLSIGVRVALLILCALSGGFAVKLLVGSVTVSLGRISVLVAVILISLIGWTTLITFLPESNQKSIAQSLALGNKSHGEVHVKGKVLIAVVILCVIILAYGILILSNEAMLDWLDGIAERSKHMLFGL